MAIQNTNPEVIGLDTNKLWLIKKNYRYRNRALIFKLTILPLIFEILGVKKIELFSFDCHCHVLPYI